MDVYRYIDNMVNVVLALFNFFSRMCSSLNFRMRKVLRKNKTLSAFRGSDECFIIGNGPSLKKVNLSKLEGKDSFCVNFFYKYPHDNFKSKFFLAIDDAFLHGEYNDYIKKIYKDYPEMIMFLRYKFSKDPSIHWDEKRVFFLYSKQFQYGNVVKWDCSKNMTSCINVVLQCIQVAMYMGYKKIYLLGCDFNQYAQLKPEHFYGADNGRGVNNMGSDARWSSMAHYHHYALQKIAKERGISIINLTEGSLIDAYPRAKFEDVIET